MRLLEFIVAMFYIILVVAIILLILVLIIPVGILVGLYFILFKRKKAV